ncbi:MAG TPA: heavy metal-binding domain-containing protein [Solirubrobacteraceae bacterium]
MTQESRSPIEAGGLPPAARRRLQGLGTEGALFTSGLSVNEFSVLGRLGPRPLAQVMGASVVRPALQLLPALTPGMNVMGGTWYAPHAPSPGAAMNRFTDASPSQVRSYLWHAEVVCELDVLTAAWNMARQRALDRLTEEALHVGGDGVVGVHLHRSDHDLGRRTIEFVVTGTAVREGSRAGKVGPALTGLSTQDVWRLRQGGYDAVGLLGASIVVFAAPARTTRLRRVRTTRQNQELQELSKAFHLARDTLRIRLGGQVKDAGAEGAVGVEFSHSLDREKLSLASSLSTLDSRGWRLGRFGIPYYVSGKGEADRHGWVITMHMYGTAVRRSEQTPANDLKTAIRMGAR